MTRETLGTHTSGDAVDRVRISTARLTVDILTLGAILESVRLDDGPNMTVPPENPMKRPADAAFIGPIVGPVVNRLTTPVTLDGHTLDLPYSDPEGILLHSGAGGTHNRVWKIGALGPQEVTLSIDLPDGLGGFPGNRTIWATWKVEETDLILILEAITDAPTLMNVAHHPYWALDAARREGHELTVAAERYTPTTEMALPTGEILPVADSEFDFRKPAEPATTLDANMCLADKDRETPEYAATLTSAGGRRLDVLTTAAGIQVFTGKPYGIALEPQMWPNAPAHPDFPSIRFEPSHTFRQTTIYRFSNA